jgi:phosphatidylserine decarboxylase
VHDRTGQFNLAYDLNKSRFNDKAITTVRPANSADAPIADAPIADVQVTQIAGMLARCVVNNKHAGDSAVAGKEMGMIRLGSRVDVQLPPGARFVPNLHMNQKIKAGDVIAHYSVPLQSEAFHAFS